MWGEGNRSGLYLLCVLRDIAHCTNCAPFVVDRAGSMSIDWGASAYGVEKRGVMRRTIGVLFILALVFILGDWFGGHSPGTEPGAVPEQAVAPAPPDLPGAVGPSDLPAGPGPSANWAGSASRYGLTPSLAPSIPPIQSAPQPNVQTAPEAQRAPPQPPPPVPAGQP
jgi:hypothetical protein